jgi:hypothetical protein
MRAQARLTGRQMIDYARGHVVLGTIPDPPRTAGRRAIIYGLRVVWRPVMVQRASGCPYVIQRRPRCELPHLAAGSVSFIDRGGSWRVANAGHRSERPAKLRRPGRGPAVDGHDTGDRAPRPRCIRRKSAMKLPCLLKLAFTG